MHTALAPGMAVLKFVFTNCHKNGATELKTVGGRRNEWKPSLCLNKAECHCSLSRLSQLYSCPHELTTEIHGVVIYRWKVQSGTGNSRVSEDPGLANSGVKLQEAHNSWAAH